MLNFQKKFTTSRKSFLNTKKEKKKNMQDND